MIVRYQWVQWVALFANAVIIACYFNLATDPSKESRRSFHWANALGCFPVLAVEFMTGAWSVVPLTACFGIIGWIGVFRGRHDRKS